MGPYKRSIRLLAEKIGFYLSDFADIINGQVSMRPYPNHRYWAPQQVRMLDGSSPRSSFLIDSQTGSKVLQSACIASEERRSRKLPTVQIRD